MLLQPTLVLLVGIEIIQHDVKLAVGKGCNDLVHEAKEFDAPAPLFVLAQNLAGSRATPGRTARALPDRRPDKGQSANQGSATRTYGYRAQAL